MEELEFLVIMGTLTLLAGLCSVVFSKLRLPPIIGYLFAGILIANVVSIPASSGDIISVLSDIGLVMLMFSIGMELDLSKLKANGRFAMVVAIVQLPLMVLCGYVAGTLMGLNPVQAITLGAVISGSSTAVVTAVLKMYDRITKEEAETMILVTVMEDVGQVIILSMVAPMFAGGSMEPASLVIMIAMIVVFMLGSIFLGIRFVPRLLDWVGRQTSSEVLMVLAVGLCFGMALLSVRIGMSMAIGSFLMGVIVSQCCFSKSIEEKVMPMRELFMAIFFISIGMEVVMSEFIGSLGMALLIFLTFAVSKFATVFLGYFIGNRSVKDGFIASVSLMAMGEFAFIIAKEAFDAGVVDSAFYTAVIGAALISMVVLPLTSRHMFGVIDWYGDKHPRLLTRFIDWAVAAREDLYTRMEASAEVSRRVRSSANRAYSSIFLIVVIEVVFILLSETFTGELSSYFGTTTYQSHLVVMAVNFFLLVTPTTVLVRNIKFIDKIMLGINSLDKPEGYSERAEMYRSLLYYSTALLVATIDLLILLLLPGPFGTTGSFVIVPVVVAMLLIGVYLAKRKKSVEVRGDEGSNAQP